MSSKDIGAKPAVAAKAVPQEEVTFVERINDFMHRNRRVFLALGVAVIASVVALGIVSVVSRDLVAKSTAALEALEASYLAFQEAGEAEKAGKAAELVAQADSLVSKYGKRYAAAKASMIKAEALLATNDLAGAEKAFLAAALAFPKSHLAPVALANAAAAAEDRGDTDAALGYLIKAEAGYPAAPGSGRITLSIGRIHETAKHYDKAMEAYGRLVASGKESDWTKIAHARIIFLKSQGLAK